VIGYLGTHAIESSRNAGGEEDRECFPRNHEHMIGRKVSLAIGALLLERLSPFFPVYHRHVGRSVCPTLSPPLIASLLLLVQSQPRRSHQPRQGPGGQGRSFPASFRAQRSYPTRSTHGQIILLLNTNTMLSWCEFLGHLLSDFRTSFIPIAVREVLDCEPLLVSPRLDSRPPVSPSFSPQEVTLSPHRSVAFLGVNEGRS
jgi:hypothetical protein